MNWRSGVIEGEFHYACLAAEGWSIASRTNSTNLGLPNASSREPGLTGTARCPAASIVIWSRLATTVLVEIGRFPCTGPRELYDGVSRIPWEQWLDPDGYVSVHGHVRHPMIRNSMYANQLVKDALCDRMVDRMGRRPDSGPDRSGVVVDLYWAI